MVYLVLFWVNRTPLKCFRAPLGRPCTSLGVTWCLLGTPLDVFWGAWAYLGVNGSLLVRLRVPLGRPCTSHGASGHLSGTPLDVSWGSRAPLGVIGFLVLLLGVRLGRLWTSLVPPGLFWAFGGTLTHFEREYLVSVMAEFHEVECPDDIGRDAGCGRSASGLVF